MSFSIYPKYNSKQTHAHFQTSYCQSSQGHPLGRYVRMNDNKDKKKTDMRGQNLQQALSYQAHHQYFEWQPLEVKWITQRGSGHSPPSRKPLAVQEEISDIPKSELCSRDHGASPFNWGSLYITFKDMSSGCWKHLWPLRISGFSMSSDWTDAGYNQKEGEQSDLNLYVQLRLKPYNKSQLIFLYNIAQQRLLSD